jgi:hypothetical protein
MSPHGLAATICFAYKAKQRPADRSILPVWRADCLGGGVRDKKRRGVSFFARVEALTGCGKIVWSERFLPSVSRFVALSGAFSRC